MTDALDRTDHLLDATIDREEAVELDFEELRVTVPVRTGDDPPRAEWEFDGRLTLSVEGVRRPLAEWLALAERAHDGADRPEGERANGDRP